MLYATYLLADLFPIGLMLAALSDIRSMTIPNKLTLALAIAFSQPLYSRALLALNGFHAFSPAVSALSLA